MDGVEGFLDEPFLVAYAPVEGTDLVVLVHAPKSAAYALVSSIGTNLGVLIGGAILGLAVLGLTIGRNTVQSLGDLKANELESGTLDVDVQSERTDEIGQLYGVFASMRDSLRRKMEEATETAAEAQTVPAAAEQQSASLNQVSSGVERLADRAEELSRLTSEFETESEAGRSPSPAAAASLPGGEAATDGGESRSE